MGSTSRGRIAKLMVGETALEVLMNADVPLFLSQ
jgi:nucleotide-binding universal stress UspA family protein